MNFNLSARVVAEFLGTAFLLAAVVGGPESWPNAWQAETLRSLGLRTGWPPAQR